MGGHLFLRILSNSERDEDVRAFLRLVNTLTAQGDLARVDAILQVSAPANKEIYRRIYKKIKNPGLHKSSEQAGSQHTDSLYRKDYSAFPVAGSR